MICSLDINIMVTSQMAILCFLFREHFSPATLLANKIFSGASCPLGKSTDEPKGQEEKSSVNNVEEIS